MIWLFTPTQTGSWFDIREFDFNERWEPCNFKWIKVIDYSNSLNKLPRFKPHNICEYNEWIDQFREYSWFTWKVYTGEVVVIGGAIFRNTEDQTKLF